MSTSKRDRKYQLENFLPDDDDYEVIVIPPASDVVDSTITIHKGRVIKVQGHPLTEQEREDAELEATSPITHNPVSYSLTRVFDKSAELDTTPLGVRAIPFD